MPTNLDKKDMAKTMEGVHLRTNTKKGDPRICSNNRTIALISHASKVMLKVIQHRLDMYMKQEMAIEQAGFTKGRGTRDQISNLRWIMERSTEYQRPIYMCFIDYSKAFDCVDNPTLWNMMEEMGVPEHTVQVIRSLYCYYLKNLYSAFSG